jgi:3-isopropylmalate/(R)-2-methylmalate dehydratase small subunit
MQRQRRVRRAGSCRERFLEGLDDIGITLRSEAAITAYEQQRPSWMPSVTMGR